MKRPAFLLLLAAGACAAQADTFIDNARVRAVQPQYESVQVPREECRSQWVNEAQPAPNSPSLGGIAIGAVVGGLLGNQVGKGHGREAATAAGAVAGAVVGNQVAGANQPPQYTQGQREVRECRQVVDMQQRLTGYRVTYDYRGHEYTTVLRQEPGANLAVRVSIEPMEPEAERPQRQRR